MFAIIILYNYTKDHASKKIYYFKKKINEKIVLVFISNNISFDILLGIFVYINKKIDIIINKI